MAIHINTYRFFAPLPVAVGHFESVRLRPPFKIESWPIKEIIRVWRLNEGIPKFHVEVRCDGYRIQSHNKRAFVVTGKARLSHNDSSVDDVLAFHRKLESLANILEEQIRMLRLYMRAHIVLFDQYWYYQDRAGVIEPIQSSSRDYDIEPYRPPIKRKDIEPLNTFLRRTRIPLSHNYLQLAWDHFDQSFDAGPDHLKILSLVMAMEALFNVGQTDLRYRIARSLAVLLGKYPHSSESIFKYVKEVYDARSKLVHTGKANLKDIHISTLRIYVQEALLKLIDLDLPKETIAEALTRLPFGQGGTITRRKIRETLRDYRWEQRWSAKLNTLKSTTKNTEIGLKQA